MSQERAARPTEDEVADYEPVYDRPAVPELDDLDRVLADFDAVLAENAVDPAEFFQAGGQ